MEKILKIAIVVAIAIGLILFSLFLITIIPHIVSNTQRDWSDILTPKLTNDEVMKIFSSNLFIQNSGKNILMLARF